MQPTPPPPVAGAARTMATSAQARRARERRRSWRHRQARRRYSVPRTRLAAQLIQATPPPLHIGSAAKRARRCYRRERDVRDDGGDDGGGAGRGGADKCRACDAAEHAGSTYDRQNRGGEVSVIAATSRALHPARIRLSPRPAATHHAAPRSEAPIEDVVAAHGKMSKYGGKGEGGAVASHCTGGLWTPVGQSACSQFCM